MKKYFIIAILSLCFIGCGVAQDFKQLNEKRVLLQKEIKAKHGWDVEVGWFWQDGALAEVEIGFKVDDIADQQVSGLRDAMNEDVLNIFESKPQALIIKIISGKQAEAQKP